MSAALDRIANLTGLRTSATTWTSTLKPAKLTSQLVGSEPNQVLNVIACSIVYVPPGSGSIVVKYEADNLGTKTFSLGQNPYTYKIVAGTAADSTFVLADSTSDSTASDTVRKDDVYFHHQLVNTRGKTFEFEISSSSSVAFEILGFDLELQDEGRAEAYVDGAN